MKKLTMTQGRETLMKIRQRFWASLLAVVLMLGCIMIPDTQAEASSLSLGVSASSVKIGDTVTVSITVPAGVSATVNVTYPTGTFSFSSASDTASSNGGTVSMTIGSYGSSNTKTTGTMKFKAKAAGSATFSASAPIAGNQDGDRVNVGGASASVSVKNESNDDSTNSGNNNTDSSSSESNESDADANKRKSADNSLSTLTLSSGTLSPSFKYNVTNYTTEVANDVTSVVVSAKPSNENAIVESVSGGENLAVGANKIQIVVKAENGVTATYTITVTRKEAGDTDESADQDNQDDQDEQKPDENDTPQEQNYEIGGVTMYPSEDGDESQIPEGFTLSEITLGEKAYPYWVNDKIGSDVGLIYLVDENKENGAWYRISENSPYEAAAFICLKSEYGYIIAVPEKMSEAAPSGYQTETINIEGKGTVEALARAGDEAHCLLYAVNQDGEYGLYQYDMQDRTYMRYRDNSAENVQVPESTETQPDNAGVNDLESQNRLLFYAFVVVVAILLIVIIILVVTRRRDDDEEDEDDEDDEDEDDEDEDGGEFDLSDERAGASKRYDRSEFLTRDEETEAALAQAVAQTLDEDAKVEAAEDEAQQEDPDSEDAQTDRDEDAYEDVEDEDDYEDEPKKARKEKRGFFGRRKKKKNDEEEDIEFLDL